MGVKTRLLDSAVVGMCHTCQSDESVSHPVDMQHNWRDTDQGDNLLRCETQQQIYDQLMHWLRDEGAEGAEAISIRDFNHGGNAVRGLAAKRDFASGDVILRIPERLLFLKRGSDSDFRLALLLERQKGPTSKWASYIKALPTEDQYSKFYTTYADPQVLHEHLDLPVARRALERRHDSWEAAEKNHRLGLKFKDFLWADAVISSRTFGLANKSAMVPLGDLMNTSLEPNVEWSKDLQNGFMLFRAKHDIKRGDELTDSYQVSSKKDNDTLLGLYGLLLSGNAKHMSTTKLNDLDCTRRRRVAGVGGTQQERSFDILRSEGCSNSAKFDHSMFF
eukprot:TRINITY_DN24440_c0_g1_i1.p1 TRINITY_DN24440_c0_g1~~TRINITY_DN24440_c0_g1_i1.p1  ORF type:complete len:334 (+),score=22.16 TRINITY_DN24440_c0_g1_i1:61-1062(+)